MCSLHTHTHTHTHARTHARTLTRTHAKGNTRASLFHRSLNCALQLLNYQYSLKNSPSPLPGSPAASLFLSVCFFPHSTTHIQTLHPLSETAACYIWRDKFFKVALCKGVNLVFSSDFHRKLVYFFSAMESLFCRIDSRITSLAAQFLTFCKRAVYWAGSPSTMELQ